MSLRPFHLAFPVRDIAEARAFYGGLLGCREGRSADDWDEAKKQAEDLAPSQGKVPILWDGDCVVWDSLAIIDFLADRVGRDRFWRSKSVV